MIGTIDALQRLHSSAEEPSLPDIFTKQSLNATLASALSSTPLPWSDLQVKVIRYVCCAYIFFWLYSYFVYDLHVCGFLLLVQVYQYWFLGSRPILSKIVVVGWCIFFFLSHKNKTGFIVWIRIFSPLIIMPKSKCLNIVKVLLTLSNVVVYDLFIYNESYWQFFSVFFCNRLLEYSFEQFAEPPPPQIMCLGYL